MPMPLAHALALAHARAHAMNQSIREPTRSNRPTSQSQASSVLRSGSRLIVTSTGLSPHRSGCLDTAQRILTPPCITIIHASPQPLHPHLGSTDVLLSSISASPVRRGTRWAMRPVLACLGSLSTHAPLQPRRPLRPMTSYPCWGVEIGKGEYV